MTHKSIKLLALAVIYGCSLIGLAIVPAAGDARILLMFASFLVPISHNRYFRHVHNFEMTCYYVAPILPAQFIAEQRSKRDSGIRKSFVFLEVLTILRF